MKRGFHGTVITKQVALVEDETDLAELLRHHLTKNGMSVRVFSEGHTALAAIHRSVPDVLILDLMLPGMDGLEICRRLRRAPETAALPILMLTARGDDTDQVAGLEVGADDYVTKPVSPRVLVARTRALLRRNEHTGTTAEILQVGDIKIDSGRHEVFVGSKAVALTHKEFVILKFLAMRPGRVRPRSELVDSIAGGPNILERTVDVHVATIRRKLGSAGDRLETVIGVGYRLRDFDV